MPKFFKSQPINTVMRFRAGAGYLILKTGDNPVTHCEVYCAGGMFRHVSDEKPVEMQYSDEDGEVFSVSRRSIKVLSAFSKILWSPYTSWAIAAVSRTGGKPIIATFCPKHGATDLNSGGALEYPLLEDAHPQAHYLATGCRCRQSAGDSPTCRVHHPPQDEPQP